MRKRLWIVCFLALLPWFFVPSPVQAKSKIDIVFIIDRSGSMSSAINNVKNKVNSFTDKLQARGVSYRLGLVTYEADVTRYDLTSDVNVFKQNVGRIYVDGGTENGLDAIMEAATRYPFDLNSSKYFILIGDELVYSRYSYTLDSVKQYLSNNNITLTAIGISDIQWQFKQLSDATGGLYLDLYSDFDRNLEYIFDQIQRIPTLEIVSPALNQVVGNTGFSFIPTVRVTDPDVDPLTLSYYIDQEPSPRETRTVTNTGTSQTISFQAPNLQGLSEGVHEIRYTVFDGTDTVQDTVRFVLDLAPPTLGPVSFTSTDTTIQIAGSASDWVSGLDGAPYRFTVGSETGAWTSSTSFARSNLTPNTPYYTKFEARDAVGHIAAQERQLYTKAQTPSLYVASSSETGLELSFQDLNPSYTKYQVKVGAGYAAADGTLTAVPQWITPTNKQLSLKGLTPNTGYVVQAKAVNDVGEETAFSAQTAGTTLALPPAALTAEVAQRSIRITWPATAGTVSYEIEADGVVVNTGTSNEYLHSGLLPNTPHNYRVRVRNAGGIGNWSAVLTKFTLPDPPPVPSAIQTTPLQTEITVSWDAVARAASYDVEADGVVYENIVSNSFVHRGLEPLTNHTYRVRAKNPGGTSEWSPPVTRRTLPYPPPTPARLTAEPSIHKVTIAWDAAEGADAYELEADGFIIDNGNATQYTDEGLEPLTGHMYRVRARNDGGRSAWSDPVHVTTHPEIPTAPTNLMATSEENSITVTWYKVLHTDSYDVEIDGETIVNVTDNQFVHSDLSPDTRHTYRVRAKNISGDSPWSNPVTMSTLPGGGDSALTLTNIAAIVTNTFITISWDTVAPNALYDVEVDGVLMDNGANTIYNHTGLKADEFHTYKIRVKDQDRTGDWVAILSLSTLLNSPDAPSGLEAFPTFNSIELRWQKVDGATGYDLEIDGQTISVGSETGYLHQPLEPGTAHTYRIRAKNVTGVTAWSPAIVRSTNNPSYFVNGKTGTEFGLTLLAYNVQDFSELTYVVTYNPNEMEPVDLYAFTPQADAEGGKIPDSSLEAEYTPGRIAFKVNRSIVPGTSWSGEITTIVFRSLIDGQVQIDAIVE